MRFSLSSSRKLHIFRQSFSLPSPSPLNDGRSPETMNVEHRWRTTYISGDDQPPSKSPTHHQSPSYLSPPRWPPTTERWRRPTTHMHRFSLSFLFSYYSALWSPVTVRRWREREEERVRKKERFVDNLFFVILGKYIFNSRIIHWFVLNFKCVI